MCLPNGWQAEESTYSHKVSTQILTCTGALSAGLGMRPTISSTKAMARETRLRLQSSKRAEWQVKDVSE